MITNEFKLYLSNSIIRKLKYFYTYSGNFVKEHKLELSQDNWTIKDNKIIYKEISINDPIGIKGYILTDEDDTIYVYNEIGYEMDGINEIILQPSISL